MTCFNACYTTFYQKKSYRVEEKNDDIFHFVMYFPNLKYCLKLKKAICSLKDVPFAVLIFIKLD